MIKLDKISKIGIGTYRMTLKDKKHINTLEYAIENGVNLVDTASNYQFGDSERLVGEVINNKKREGVFIISKGGYIHGGDIEKVNKIQNYIKIDSEFYYSLDIEFLKIQFYQSLHRLKTDYMDCFLIHNPEHYFDVENIQSNRINEDILTAFTFLETLVNEGKLRYYGISSNNFDMLNSNGVQIENLLNSKGSFPSFKIIQFPYNLVEMEASKKIITTKSLLDLCASNNIISISNRPLNTIYKGKVLRLSNCHEDINKLLDEKREGVLFHKLLDKIKGRLLEFDTSIEEFTPIKFFIDNRKNIANAEAISSAIQNHLLPFFKELDLIDKETINLIIELQNYWILFSKKDNEKRLNNFREDLIQKNIIHSHDNRNLSLIACETYLNKGIDHVLIGMRNKKYIDQMLELL